MVFCINAVAADHFKVPVRDMHDQAFDKVNGGAAFCDRFMVLMALDHPVDVIQNILARAIGTLPKIRDFNDRLAVFHYRR